MLIELSLVIVSFVIGALGLGLYTSVIQINKQKEIIIYNFPKDSV